MKKAAKLFTALLCFSIFSPKAEALTCSVGPLCFTIKGSCLGCWDEVSGPPTYICSVNPSASCGITCPSIPASAVDAVGFNCNAAPCIVKGVTVPDGDTRDYYKPKKNGTCIGHARTCTNGTLGPPFGGFDYPACNACDLDGIALENGESHTAYSAPDAVTGVCTSETRTCNGGDLTGSLEFSTCTPIIPPEPCTKAGLITWRPTKNKVQWCNGINWKDAGLNNGANCPGVPAGKISFNGGILQYCDGSNWVSMKGSSLGNCSAKAGTFKFVPASSTFEYCDGAQSWKIGP